MSKILNFLIITFFILSFKPVQSQEISYYDINNTLEKFKGSLANSNEYFSGGSTDYPYYQGKSSNSYIKFYRSTATTCVIDLKSEQDFVSLVREIQRSAKFRFKFCTSYQEPVVYNYETNSGNKIRFSLDQMRISIEYPSAISSLMNENFGLTSVFVCLSNDAYAYHTNLKCEGLGNCDTDIAKSNISEAKKYNYKFCEICTRDNY